VDQVTPGTIETLVKVWDTQGHADPRLYQSRPGSPALRTTNEACNGTCARVVTFTCWSHWECKDSSASTCFTVWGAIATYEASLACDCHASFARHTSRPW
jgi:hypothetical protein